MTFTVDREDAAAAVGDPRSRTLLPPSSSPTELTDGEDMNLTFRKSSYSSDTANCVEVGISPQLVGVRDSKDTGGPVLLVDARSWRHFLAGIHKGHYDR